MKKKFGIIGAGNIAKAIAGHLVKAGYSVMLSNRNTGTGLTEVYTALGSGVMVVTPKEAAQADIVILAMPWSQLSTLTDLTKWENRIVIDATNHFITFAPDFQLDDLKGRASSEVVADFIPGAHVVKAFNTLYYKVLEANPKITYGNRVLFMSGDDADSKNIVGDIIKSLQFAVIDLGALAIGGKLQQAKGPLAAINLIKEA